jgi:hypothetical protein
MPTVLEMAGSPAQVTLPTKKYRAAVLTVEGKAATLFVAAFANVFKKYKTAPTVLAQGDRHGFIWSCDAPKQAIAGFATAHARHASFDAIHHTGISFLNPDDSVQAASITFAEHPLEEQSDAAPFPYAAASAISADLRTAIEEIRAREGFRYPYEPTQTEVREREERWRQLREEKRKFYETTRSEEEKQADLIRLHDEWWDANIPRVRADVRRRGDAGVIG